MRSLWTNEGRMRALTNEWGVYCQLIGNNAVSSRPILWPMHSILLHIAPPLSHILPAYCLSLSHSQLRNTPDQADPRETVGSPSPSRDKYCNILNINHPSEFSCGHYYPPYSIQLPVQFWGPFQVCSCLLIVSDGGNREEGQQHFVLFVFPCGHRR